MQALCRAFRPARNPWDGDSSCSVISDFPEQSPEHEGVFFMLGDEVTQKVARFEIRKAPARRDLSLAQAREQCCVEHEQLTQHVRLEPAALDGEMSRCRTIPMAGR